MIKINFLYPLSAWRILKKGPGGDINKYNTSDIVSLTRLRDKIGGSELDRLVSFIINSRNTFGNKGTGKIYRSTNPVTNLPTKNLVNFINTAVILTLLSLPSS